MADPITGPAYQGNINVGQGRDGYNGQTYSAERYGSLGGAAALRSAYQPSYQDSLGRVNQLSAASMMHNAAYGQAPSAAEIAGRQNIQDSLQAQLAGAASSNGGSLGQAAAMRQAQINAGAFQARGLQTLAANRAAEMAQARNDYANLAGSMRGQDLQQYGLQSQNEYQQRQLNQQAQLGYAQLANQADYQQAQADLGVAGLNAANWQSWQTQQQIQGGENQRQANQLALEREKQQMQMQMAGIGGVAAIGGALLTHGASSAGGSGGSGGSDGSGGGGDGGGVPPEGMAKGGPVRAGTPYLVGEQGPELVVPQQNATVIPAPQTAAIMNDPMPLYEPPGQYLQQSPEGRGYLMSAPQQSAPRASLMAVPAQRPTLAIAAMSRPQLAPPKRRQKTPEELMAEADRMQAAMQAEHDARMAQGPAVSQQDRAYPMTVTP